VNALATAAAKNRDEAVRMPLDRASAFIAHFGRT
jgi:hypothetical protein